MRLSEVTSVTFGMQEEQALGSTIRPGGITSYGHTTAILGRIAVDQVVMEVHLDPRYLPTENGLSTEADIYRKLACG